MKHDERDEALRANLVEYLAGCAANPEALERLLAEDEHARALLEDARRELALFREAASSEDFAGDELVLVPPPAASRGRSVRRWLAAAVLLLVPGTLFGLWGLAHLNLRDVRRSGMELTVSAPGAVTPGAPVRLRVEASDLERAPVQGTLRWAGLDAAGGTLFTGERAFDGLEDLDFDPSLDLRSIEVAVSRGGVVREQEIDLVLAKPRPLVHLAQDKPLYRPGETVFLRALALNRLSFEPLEGRARLRIVDPKGTVVDQTSINLQQGVASWSWSVPADAPGGKYRFVFRDRKDELDAESLEFLVRSFQPPRLAKEVVLDRHTYAPGERVLAEIAVARVEGGASAGAKVRAACVVDGTEIASEDLVLDDAGEGLVAFTLPATVERGEGRLVVRVTDGGTVETTVEPFVVPTGAIAASFFPEGGDLVLGVAGRVYAEFTDSLGRPTSARGRVVDEQGTVLANVETAHLGWARFELRPEVGRTYRFEFDEPASAALELPAARATGVALRSLADSTGAARNVRLQLDVAEEDDHVVGLFCRGALVAQAVVRGAGRHVVELTPRDDVAGVLRATVFDRTLTPIAERLVHREGAQRVDVVLEPAARTLLPGEAQTLTVRTTDERGQALSAVVGLAVSDHAVRALAGEPRVGLENQAWLFADVEELEERAGFFPEDADAAFHVDLLLGTRGWRRFGWRDSAKLIADQGERAQRLLAREGRASELAVLSQSGDSWERVQALRMGEQRRRGIALFSAFVAGLLALAWGVYALLGRVLGPRRRVVRGIASVAWIGLLTTAFLRLAAPGADFAVALDAPTGEFAIRAGLAAPPEQEVALVDDLDRLRELGYAGGPVGGPGQAWGPGAAGPVGAWKGAPGAGGGGGPISFGAPIADLFVAEKAIEEAEELIEGVEFDRADRRLQQRPMGQPRVYAHKHPASRQRTDFAETLFWNPLLVTDARGEVTVRFDTSDRVTSWEVNADAHGGGRIGQASARFETLQPFTLEASLPVELSQGDRVELPVAVRTGAADVSAARFGAVLEGPARVLGDVASELALEAGAARVYLPFEVTEGPGDLRLALSGEAAGWVDRVGRTIKVVPRGFPARWSTSGRVSDLARFQVIVPEDPIAGSLTAKLDLYPSPLADLMAGVDGILREPHGCFEQTSSSHYPNLLALRFIDEAAADEPAARRRALALVEKGYQRLVSFECSKRGYEWFGNDPGHEALTAYGLFEFHDQNAVLPVDPAMVERTRDWLLAARDGKGGFLRERAGLHSWAAAPEVSDAYILTSLLESGEQPADFQTEIDVCETRTRATDDPYLLALGARALFLGERFDAAGDARERLGRLQADDGSLPGAATSITSSRGKNLEVETAALAVLAWLDDAEDAVHVDRAIEFLVSQRSGGTFGATQATVQALRALVGYALDRRRVANDGSITVLVDGREVARRAFTAGEREVLALDLAPFLVPGEHEVELRLSGDNDFPFAFQLQHFAEQPADVPGAPLVLTTTLAETSVEEGRSVNLAIELVNRRSEAVMMPLAIIGLPAGLEAPTEVLDDLERAGRFAHWEITGRELVLYFAGLEANAVTSVSLDLVATLPGTTRGPASRAYPYYENDAVRWTPPLEVTVRAGR